MNKLFWISSYPRSGNTFIRVALTCLLYNNETHKTDKKIPEFVVNDDEKFISDINLLQDEVVFAKTHAPYPPDITLNNRKPCGIYIYRHPLDVFLSVMNYVYINSDNEWYRQIYTDGHPKSVDELYETGELKKYFEELLENDGLKIMEPFAGKWNAALAAWGTKHLSKPDSWLFANYTEVIENTEIVIEKICTAAGIEKTQKEIADAVKQAKEITKPDGQFYWRGEAGYFKNYLNTEQIESYFQKYEKTWLQFGIEFQK